MKGSNKKSNFFEYAMIGIVVFCAGFLVKRKVVRKAEAPPPIVASVPTKRVVSSAPAEAPKATPTPIVNVVPLQPSETVESNEQGLCRFKAEENLIHWRVVKHLVKQKPQYVLLPRMHQHCWTISNSFRVVDYEASSDMPFDYYGNVEVGLQREQTFLNYQNFVDLRQDYERFGFKTARDVFDWMSSIGAQPSMELAAFRVQGTPRVSIRQPIGNFSYYPGVKVISRREAEEKYRQRYYSQIIDLQPEKEKAIFSDAKKISNINFAQNGSPAVALMQAKNIPQLTSLNSMNHILIIGINREDRNPFYLASGLLAMGIKDISVLEGGTAGMDAPGVLTPTDISGVRTVGAANFPGKAEDALIIDSRTARNRNTFYIKKAVPIGLDEKSFGLGGSTKDMAEYVSTGSLPAKYDLSQNQRIMGAQAKLGKTKVVIVGMNDFDWMPVILAENFKKTGKHQIVWMRGGMEEMEIASKLGLPMGGAKKSFKAKKMYKERIVQVAHKKTGEVSKIAFLEKIKPKAKAKSTQKSKSVVK